MKAKVDLNILEQTEAEIDNGFSQACEGESRSIVSGTDRGRNRQGILADPVEDEIDLNILEQTEPKSTRMLARPVKSKVDLNILDKQRPKSTMDSRRVLLGTK